MWWIVGPALPIVLLATFVGEVTFNPTWPLADFWVNFAAMRAAWTGHVVYHLVSNPFLGAVFTYPPVLATLGSPLAALGCLGPIAPASRLQPAGCMAPIVWQISQFGFLLASVAVLLHSFGRLNRRSFISALAICGCFLPVYSSFLNGQVNFLILFALSLTLSWYLSQRQMAAGLAFSLACWIKLTPFVLVAYFIYRRQWRLLAGLALGSLILIAISAANQGWQSWWTWLTQVLPAESRGVIVPSFNFSPITAAYLSLIHLGVGQAAAQTAAHVIQLAIDLLGLMALLWAGRRLEPSRANLGLEFSTWVAFTLVASPVTWDHHLVLLIPLLLWGVRWSSRASPSWATWWVTVTGIDVVVLGFMVFDFSIGRAVGHTLTQSPLIAEKFFASRPNVALEWAATTTLAVLMVWRIRCMRSLRSHNTAL